MFEGISDKADLTPTEVIREVKVLDEEMSIEGAPEFKVEGVYIDHANYKKMTRHIQGKDKPTDADEDKLRSSIVIFGLRSWTGLTFINLCRVSDWCFMHRDALWEVLKQQDGVENKTDEIPFSTASAEWLAKKMNFEHFKKIMDGLSSQEDYVLEAIKKNIQ